MRLESWICPGRNHAVGPAYGQDNFVMQQAGMEFTDMVAVGRHQGQIPKPAKDFMKNRYSIELENADANGVVQLWRYPSSESFGSDEL